MSLDNRSSWEIDLCGRLKFACTYLDMMALTGKKRHLVSGAYNANGRLNEWCEERMSTILARCDRLLQEHGAPSPPALIAVGPYAERLAKAGHNGAAILSVLFRA